MIEDQETNQKNNITKLYKGILNTEHNKSVDQK